MMSRSLPTLLTLFLIVGSHAASALAEQRVGGGLLVLYDFSEGKGRTFRDGSGAGQPIDLTIRVVARDAELLIGQNEQNRQD